MASGDTKTEAMLNVLGNGGSGDEFRGCCNTKTQQYILDAIDRVQNVEDEVEELKNNPDVVDIVDTYADLQAYDTSKLTDKDIIRVLADETHSGNSTYYRFTKSSNTWTFIGEVSGGVNVVQTTGTSITDVMSQNATTSMVFADPGTNKKVRIGNINTNGNSSVSIGSGGSASGNYSIQIGSSTANSAFSIAIGGSSVYSDYGIAIGQSATISAGSANRYSVALGAYAKTTRGGEVNIGTGTESYGYNSTHYRVLGGVHDGQLAQDAATVAQVNATIDAINTALSLNIPHVGATT